MDKIDAIGEVQNNSNVETKIAQARAAYEALTDDQKAKVGEDKYAALTDAEATFVDFDIDDIGEVELSDKCADNIEYARTAYDALTDEAKAKVTKLAVLEAAEKSYADLVAADAVQTLIDDIGEVAYTAESKAKIDAAKAAFDALSADQRNLLNNAYKLNNAVQKYRILETTALIDAIGTVEYTAECKDKIDAARTAYDALGAKLQPAIENAETLTTAEGVYATIKADHDAAAEVKDLIASIGTVEYTEGSKTNIDAARAAYNALTADQKALVDTYETLTTAEGVYATIKADHDAAEAVAAKITALPDEENVDVNDADAIAAARAAYEALSVEAKAIVPGNVVIKLAAAEGVIADIDSVVVTDGEIKTYSKDFAASEAESGVDVKQLFKQAAKETSVQTTIKAGDVTVTFDAAATKAIGAGAGAFSVKVIEEAADDEELRVELELKGATFAEGKAIVRIPFNGEVPKGKIVKVYYVAEDGARTDMNATLEDGYLVFTTTHFSTYVVSVEKAKGVSGGVIVLIVILCLLALGCGGFAIYWFVIKKKTWAEFVIAFKKIWAVIVDACKKAWIATANFFKNVWAKIAGLKKKKNEQTETADKSAEGKPDDTDGDGVDLPIDAFD